LRVTKIQSYKDLIAWQKAMELVEAVYRLTAGYPGDERFGLISQTRRAAISIPSNIAEGYGRQTRANYTQFLRVSRGSANEVETQLLLAIRLGYVSTDQTRAVMNLTLEVQRILSALISSLSPDR